MIAIGGVIGALVIALDSVLKARGAKFRVPVLGAAIGIYLPLELMVPIFLGGLLAYVVERARGVTQADDETRERVHRPGVLFSAGLITGEALTGIVIAIPIVVAGRADVLALPAALQFGGIVGLAVIALVAWLLYRAATRGAIAAAHP